MADEKAKEDKAPKGDKGAKTEKTDKAPKAETAAAKPAKAAKGGKEPSKGRPTVGANYETSSGRPSGPKEKPRLATHYSEKVLPVLMQKFGYKSVMQVPRIRKITLNMGVGETTTDKKVLDNAVADLTKIAGQKPVITKARKSIANFKVRANFPVGCMVTLRGARMYEFFDRLVNIAMPRIRDFRGVSNRAFDGRGNYNLGFKEQIIFPEIDYDKIDTLRGMNIAITTTAKTDDEARALLAAFRFPFKH